MAQHYLSDTEIRKRAEQRLNKRKELLIHGVIYLMVNVGLWLLWFSGSEIDPATGARMLDFPFPLMTTLGWGAGLAAHVIDTYYHIARGPLESRERAVRQRLADEYGDWNSPEISEDDYKHIRADVEKRFRQRAEFLMHLAVFVPINIMLWGIWLASGDFTFPFQMPDELPWPAFATLGWGAGLLAHGVQVFGEGLRGSSRDNALEREMERERELLYGDIDAMEKAKRGTGEKEKRSRARIQTADDATLEVVDADSEDTAPYDDDLRARGRN